MLNHLLVLCNLLMVYIYPQPCLVIGINYCYVNVMCKSCIRCLYGKLIIIHALKIRCFLMICCLLMYEPGRISLGLYLNVLIINGLNDHMVSIMRMGMIYLYYHQTLIHYDFIIY